MNLQLVNDTDQPCGFFRLPRELRDTIYSYCCCHAIHDFLISSSRSGHMLFREPSLSQASRTTREECLTTFYAGTNFDMIARVNMAPRKYKNQPPGHLVLDRGHMPDFFATRARFHSIVPRVESVGIVPSREASLVPPSQRFRYGTLGYLQLTWKAGRLIVQRTEKVDRTLLGCQWQKHQVEDALLRGHRYSQDLATRQGFDGFSLQDLEDVATVLA